MTAALIDALDGLAGVTIRVRHELPEASMRLMDTLSVTVVIDPTAPPCSRFTEGHGHRMHVSTRMCARCKRLEPQDPDNAA